MSYAPSPTLPPPYPRRHYISACCRRWSTLLPTPRRILELPCGVEVGGASIPKRMEPEESSCSETTNAPQPRAIPREGLSRTWNTQSARPGRFITAYKFRPWGFTYSPGSLLGQNQGPPCFTAGISDHAHPRHPLCNFI